MSGYQADTFARKN